MAPSSSLSLLPFLLALFALSSSASAAVPVPSAGCALPAPTYPLGATTEVTWRPASGGALRRWLVHVPRSYTHNSSAPAPALLTMHGGFGSAESTENLYGLNAVAERGAFVVAYPEGRFSAWNAGTCCGAPVEQGVDDLAYLEALVDTLARDMCVDTARVYASGMSNGAFMAFHAACEIPDRFAAVASVAGTLTTAQCTPALPVPVLMIHGSNDLNVPIEGGVGCGVSGANFTSIPDTLDTFTARNQCNCTYADRAACGTPYLAIGDGTCTQLGKSPLGAEVVLCMIDGGGHAWPDTDVDGARMRARAWTKAGVRTRIRAGDGVGDGDGAGAGAGAGDGARDGAGDGAARQGACDFTVGNFPASEQIWEFVSKFSREPTKA